jgi:hypothetical protein
MAKKLLPLMEGKGSPPVSESEIMDLAGAPPFKMLRQIEADFKLIPLDRQKEAADLITLALQAFKTIPRK